MKLSPVPKLLIVSTLLLAGSTVSYGQISKALQEAMQRDRQKAETQRYEKVCKEDTKEAYQGYLDDYPSGRYAKEIRNRISEMDLWSEANQKHTIEAYNLYIKNSPYKSYERQAKDSITELISINEWNKIAKTETLDVVNRFMETYPNSSRIPNAQKRKDEILETMSLEAWKKISNTKSIEALEDFLEKYPKSSKVSAATSRIHQLSAMEYYALRNLEGAYKEFTKAGMPKVKSSEFDEVYEICAEFHDYSLLNDRSSVSQLSNFLTRHPNGAHASSVSNKLALMKARQLNDRSTSTDFSEALAYAKDDATRGQVQNYIDMAKQKAQLRKRQERVDKWNAKAKDGSVIQLGLNADYGYIMVNLKSLLPSHLFLGVGMIVGNYHDIAQFQTGFKLGLGSEGFELPVYGRLKLNIAGRNSYSGCMWYVSGEVAINTLQNFNNGTTVWWRVGSGVAWKKVDWTILFVGGNSGRLVDPDIVLGTHVGFNISFNRNHRYY